MPLSRLTGPQLGRGLPACGMLLWHGHRWGQGASRAGRRLQGLSGQQRGEGASVGLSCGPCQHSDALLRPHPHPKLASAPSSLPLIVPSSPGYPHPSPHVGPCAYTAAPAPGYVTFLMRGQGLWGLLRVTWFWVPGEEMEQR